MDFREILAKLDNIKSEAEKEPKRYTAQELMSQVDKIVFTEPTQSGIKYSIANRVEFKDKDVNDPKIKAQLFQAELKQSPSRLFVELAERIKPTSDEQIEISNIVGGAGYAFSSGKKPDMSVYPLLKAVIEKAIKEMHLERDPDQSEYKDDEADDEFESVQTEGDNIYHSCVKSFKHEKFGEGEVLHGEHTLSESGEVSHYDAKFVREDGSQFIVRNIPVANMKECVVVEHGHPKKKKKVKEEEVVDEAHYQDWKRKTIPVNKEIKLAGDSIWDKEGTNPKSVNVKEVEVTFEIDTESDDAEDRDTTYVSVQVEHDGPWTIYTDTGFESAISQMIGIDVEFTEQGMQDDGEASLEGSVATKDIPANAKPLESIKQQKTVEDDSGKDRDSVKPEMVNGVAEKIKAEYVDELKTYNDRREDVIQQLKSSGITDPKEIEREIDDMDDDILSYYFPGDIKGKIEVMNSVLELGPDADGDDIVDLVHNNGMDTSPREEIADQFQNELKKADPETFKKLYGNTQTISDVEQEDWFQGQNDVTLNGDEFYETFGWIGENDENIEEAEYQGRTVKLNKPMRGDVKKFKVYVKNPKGNIVKVNFGDPDMRIKKSNPARRKSFRARHNCDSPGPKHKARYWSCRKW